MVDGRARPGTDDGHRAGARRGYARSEMTHVAARSRRDRLSWVAPCAVLAAPIAAFWAITAGGARSAPPSASGSGRSARGGRREAAILFRDAKPGSVKWANVGVSAPAAENSRQT